MDEPTAVLTPQETTELFENLKKLCQQGKTVIIITHKLKEVMNLANHVTVFRGGRVVGEREIESTNIEDLASLMVGRKVNLTAKTPPRPVLKDSILELKNVSVEGRRCLKNLSFRIQGGRLLASVVWRGTGNPS